jgi:hemoglobin-like flavoprotein
VLRNSLASTADDEPIGSAPALASDQITFLRASFAWIEPRAGVVALMFYQRLFELDPELRRLFHTDIEVQGQKLMQLLKAAVSLLDSPAQMTRILADLGRRHRDYGVRDEHYDTVGSALLSSLDEALGARFDPATRDAWTQLYGVMASTMKEAASLEVEKAD